MSKKQLPIVSLTLDSIVGGGQAIGTLEDGRKCFVWGGLPGETVEAQITKKRSKLAEALVTKVIAASDERVEPRDPESFLSTSPWQIMSLETEQHYKSALIEEAFELHDIVLPQPIGVYTDSVEYEYRNKIEYSFWYDTERRRLELAFFRRGSHSKVPVEITSLAAPAITLLSKTILRVLNDLKIDGRAIKTLLIRSNRAGQTAWQLYIKDKSLDVQQIFDEIRRETTDSTIRGEIIFSNPKSPASVITEYLGSSSDEALSDTILDVPFRYATDGFFQINLPVYEKALSDMKEWVEPGKPVVDLYSGVGTIGLTIGGDNVTLVEVNESAVREMQRNIEELGRKEQAVAILAPSEKATEHITADTTVVVDPPRAGLHEDVVARLLEVKPARIIYLSCNPVTQARDVQRLGEVYGVRHHQGYNFFPRTPHTEHLVILDLK